MPSILSDSAHRCYSAPFLSFPLQVVDWSVVLSVGEQQRLSFLRLFVFFSFMSNEKTLVLFDESTSAIDLQTEEQIYQYLIKLNVWFVTISHRSSLAHWHHKSLHFTPNSNASVENQNQTSTSVMETEEIDGSEDQSIVKEIREEKISKWQQIISILKFLHLPFQPDARRLKLLVIDLPEPDA